MTTEQLDQLVKVLAAIALFELMAAIGLKATLTDVIGVARDWRLVGRAVLANYVFVPAAAIGLLLLFRPYTADTANYALVAAGFLLVAVCPGAPYGPPFTAMAKGNVGVAVGLMVVLAGSSALLAPLLLQLLLPLLVRFLPPLPSDAALSINVGQIVSTLLIAQLLPLCIGLAVRQWRPRLADRLTRPANLFSVVLNLALLGVIIAAQRDMLLAIPLVGYLGMMALLLTALAAGWLLSGPGKGRRTAMVMATAVRNVGVALVIATASFPGTRAVAATTAFALFQTIVLALAALTWGRLAAQTKPMVKAAGP
ncbi:MAG TPA: bile acid:sodium symporter [Gemmataceae bacterium]|nr:bile acid:sodium symporter [Gemmataceae bacterium]